MGNGDESIGRLMGLKLFIRKLQRVLLHSVSKERPDLNDVKFEDEMEDGKIIPDDVKRGFFAVTASEGGEPKRFVVELDNLTNNPAFLTLLEKAEDEFGFQQKGVLEVPCRPEELQKILNKRRRSRRASTAW